VEVVELGPVPAVVVVVGVRTKVVVPEVPDICAELAVIGVRGMKPFFVAPAPVFSPMGNITTLDLADS